MAFFGITSFGYQDHFKEHVKLPPVALPSKPKSIPLSQIDAYGPGAKGSFDEYHRIWVKHTRTPLRM